MKKLEEENSLQKEKIGELEDALVRRNIPDIPTSPSIIYLNDSVGVDKNKYNLLKITKKASLFVGNLAELVFGQETLKTHSVHGKVNNKYKIAKKPRLEEVKLNAVFVGFVKWAQEQKWTQLQFEKESTKFFKYINNKRSSLLNKNKCFKKKGQESNVSPIKGEGEECRIPVAQENNEGQIVDIKIEVKEEQDDGEEHNGEDLDMDFDNISQSKSNKELIREMQEKFYENGKREKEEEIVTEIKREVIYFQDVLYEEPDKQLLTTRKRRADADADGMNERKEKENLRKIPRHIELKGKSQWQKLLVANIDF
ncbi:uncharacterized protein LOC122505939 [Leptopilina heterotoma]|uniref:uncharacterized protein LOC122505939 n=1 Tax=Leptopilina heterotoma TaxID=63436 RepID=UPI001CA94841|nr:uncharacterized protein LOC122505939 [Leptopilina heterotoma]